jgi:hypothetical protein
VAQRLIGSTDPRIQVGVVVAAIALTYAGLFRQDRTHAA